ncbi:toprim domain-containing protein [uncultured Roseibium sp.]|uniref:DUF7146 domain-containing protein n=1 Tax=uncultured Roseibium sp. TaxID=1936171 RepID=UPI00262C371C|nr:toprim domain-containing protein [uncultured Roseibium sp.]
MSKIRDLCKNRWPSLLATMGVNKSYLQGQHGPCPICNAGKDRFRFDNRDGLGTYFCNTCGAGDGFDFLMKFKGWDFAECAKELEKIVGNADISQTRKRVPDQRVRDWMNNLWQGSKAVERSDPVATYLSGRGIRLETYPNSIRFHARCGYRHDGNRTTYHPTMLAKVTAPSGKPTTIHKTYLDSLGRKAQLPKVRMLMPISPEKGSAVRLGPVAETMGIAEGIETALSASLIWGMPVWAALNAGALMQWKPPAEASKIHIFGDFDASNAGQSAANALAHRLWSEGKEFKIEIPDEPGDWNDFLVRQQYQKAG